MIRVLDDQHCRGKIVKVDCPEDFFRFIQPFLDVDNRIDPRITVFYKDGKKKYPVTVGGCGTEIDCWITKSMPCKISKKDMQDITAIVPYDMCNKIETEEMKQETTPPQFGEVRLPVPTLEYVNKKHRGLVAGLVAVLVISLAGDAWLFNKVREESKEIETLEAPADSLSEWELFTLALIKVESEYNNKAVSEAGAKGYFQMTPIYVKEVNRMHGTEYTFDQVLDFDTAYEIFDLMQKAHNPDYDIEKAMTLHNGETPWYHRRIRKEMENIRKYEEMRSKVKNI